MRKITARIVHFFIESKVIDETDQEIYEYGLEILSENVMLTVFLILFGVAIRSVYKELHADHETGAADNK